MTRPAAPRVLVVGEALIDVVRRAGVETLRPGGSPFNVAVGLARLGIDTTLASQLGADDAGDRLRSALRRDRVTLVDLPPTPARTSRAVATLDAAGAATYDFTLRWDPARLPPAAGYAFVHIGSLGATIQPGADVVVDWAAAAAAAGVPISFDPNARPAADPGEQRRRFTQIAGFAHLIKLSADDAALLFADESLTDVVRRLAARTPLVAATLGARGALLVSGQTGVRSMAARIAVVDTIGAGDAFTAALLAQLCTDGAPRPAAPAADTMAALLRAATHAAALTCGREGADPPTRAELDAALATA